MLSLPDFKEKQILFIQADRYATNKISFWNDNIRFTKNDQVMNRASCYKIFSIFIIGDISLTSVLIKKCQEFGISIFLLNERFEEYASILSQTEGNYILRSAQYKLKNELDLAKNLVKNKVINQLVTLNKQRISSKDFTDDIVSNINKAADNQKLLGIEGNCSREFFSQYFKEINWQKRSPRTKVDIPNLLLDIGYYCLFNFVDSLLRLYGFDTYKGFYHRLFFQRKSLSCDLVEPFRYIIDYQLLKAYHLGQINDKDFKVIDGRYSLKYDKSQKYNNFFLQAIFNHREDIYEYIKSFYRFMLDQTKPMPFHKVKN